MSRPTEVERPSSCRLHQDPSAIDAEPVEDLLELLVIDVVGRMEMLGLGDEFERVVALQAILEQDLLEGLGGRGRRRTSSLCSSNWTSIGPLGLSAAMPVQPSCKSNGS